MKKTFLAIALAAVAFVGCQKEEKGMVSINLSGETYVPVKNDKEAYYNNSNSVFFSEGDAVYLNGGLCPVTILRDDTRHVARDVNDEVYASLRANLSVMAEYMHAPAISLYPASIFTPGAPFDGTSTDISDWTVTMKNRQSLINSNQTNNVVDELTNGGVTDKPAWPMLAQTPSLNNHVQLNNCVALLTPGITYGVDFVDGLVSANNLNETVDGENLPVLKVDSLVLSSTTNILAGQGHIDLNAVQNGYPVLVMDETADASYRVVCKAVDWYNADGYEFSAPTMDLVRFGHVPIAPYVDGGDLKVVLYFTLTFTDENANEHVYYCKYDGDIISNIPIVRSQRTTLYFNMWDEANVSKVTVSTTPLN